MTGFRSAQDLVAEAHAVESDIGVVEVQVAPGPVARVPAQRPKIGPAVGIDEVVEVNRFDPELSSARSAVDEGSALNAERGEATAVIQIAVDVLARGARIEPGALRDLGISAQAPVKQAAVAR